MTEEITQFETVRLTLRRLEHADTERIKLLGSDDVFEMMPEIETPFDASAWVKHKLENEIPLIGHVIITKKNNRVIGYLQATCIVEQEGIYLSVGYWLGQNYVSVTLSTPIFA